jgi:eukaryotic-like serine/threonine-protein kinase
MQLSVGDKLGPYEILAPIGKGGMGEVWKAHDPRLNRDVAIKVSAAQFSERFEREAKTIAALNHPNICQLYDVGPNYLVMELIDGLPLKGPLPVEKAVEYASQILDALDAAHRKGITHRDLKPANILLTKQGIKLLDFGLAKQGSSLEPADVTRTALTKEGQIAGTLQYMAPEQLEGKDADARSDIFSFGCVLYEMLSGRRAFGGASAASVIAAILEREPERLQTTPPLDRVIRSCLAKVPDQRFQTALDLKRNLLWAMEPTAVAATSKVRTPWIVAAGVFVLAAALAIALAVSRNGRTGANEPVSLSIDLPQGQSIQASDIAPLAISPDGKRVVYIGVTSDGPQLYMRELDSFRTTPIAGTQGAINPFFSPDGQWIAFSAGGLKKVALTGGAVQEVSNASAEYGGNWGSDDKIYFTTGSISLVSGVPATGGTLQEVITREETEEGDVWPQLLPGGKALLVTKWSPATASFDDTVIEAVDLSSRKRRVLITGGAGARFVRPNLLVYAHAGSLMTVHFDPVSLEVQGSPVRMLGDLITMPASGAPQFNVSDTGTLVYLSGSARRIENNLDWIGSGMKEPQPFGMKPGLYQSPRFSPDGRKVALTVRLPSPEIWIYDLNRGTLQQMTFAPGENEVPVWSPDGKQIAYAGNGRNQAYVFPVDGSSPERPIAAIPDHFHLHSWSADGSLIAFEKIVNRSTEIWMLPTAGSRQPYRYIDDAYYPAFSPDGRWLAYVSVSNVYIQRFPGPGERIQVSTADGTEPVWSRDGHDLYYEAGDSLFRVSVATAPSLVVGKPEVVYQGHFWRSNIAGPNYDVAPDGKRFLMVDSDKEPELTQIHVVLNWTAQLK